jgi:hypothetical protein
MPTSGNFSRAPSMELTSFQKVDSEFKPTLLQGPPPSLPLPLQPPRHASSFQSAPRFQPS